MAGEWIETKWGEIATLEYGRAIRGYQDRPPSGFRVFGTNGSIGWHDEPIYDQPSVIVGRKGAYRGIHYSPNPFFVIDTAFYLKPITPFDMKWAYYQLLTQDINSMDSGSAIPSTSRDSFYNLPLVLPPLAEQKAIAHILGTLDDKIELNRRMNHTLEAMARALFKSWFVDFDPVCIKAHAKASGTSPKEALAKMGVSAELADLFPDTFEDSELGEIPKGWGVGEVGDCFDLTMGQSPPGSSYNEQGDGIPFFQGRTDYGARYPTRRMYCTAPTRFAEQDDTLVSVRAPVGDVNLAIERCCIGRGLSAVRHKTGASSYTFYSMHSLKDRFDHFESEGTVFGAINKKSFHDLKWVEVPPAIIAAFEGYAGTWDELYKARHLESISLEQARDALLPELLSGEVRVRDVEKMVEEVGR